TELFEKCESRIDRDAGDHSAADERNNWMQGTRAYLCDKRVELRLGDAESVELQEFFTRERNSQPWPEGVYGQSQRGNEKREKPRDSKPSIEFEAKPERFDERTLTEGPLDEQRSKPRWYHVEDSHCSR